MSLPCSGKRKRSFYFFDILNFERGTRISSSLILNILIGWAVEYCGDVMFYYFLLADNFDCNYSNQMVEIILLGLQETR